MTIMTPRSTEDDTASTSTRRARKPGARATASRSSRARDDAKWFRILTLPWLLGFLLLGLAPLVVGFLISLTNYNGVTPELARYVGLRNYSRALSDPNVLDAAKRTGVFVLTYVPLSFLVALSLALLVNAGPRARGVFRSLYYLPSVVPVVGAAFIWRAMFNRDSGLVNEVLQKINPNWAPSWLGDYATQSLATMSLWLGWASARCSTSPLCRTSRSSSSRQPGSTAPATSSDFGTSCCRSSRRSCSTGAHRADLRPRRGDRADPALRAVSAGGQLDPQRQRAADGLRLPADVLGQRFGYASALLWITFAGSVW
jgi:multiple sugar transport system permease protein